MLIDIWQYSFGSFQIVFSLESHKEKERNFKVNPVGNNSS
jgi:hypothetical protein